MSRLSFLASIFVVVAMAASSMAFAPATSFTRIQLSRGETMSSSSMNMGFMGGGEEPKKLTRENEPEDFFATDMDKMSDEEKLPVALMGLAGISLPFIFGLIALYASK